MPPAGASFSLDHKSILGGKKVVGILGGEGRSASLIGALIMGVLQNGLNLLAVRPFYQQIAIGAVLVLAVWLDRLTRSEGRRR